MSVKVIEFSHYDVVVPFVCHRCGNCCRNYYPGIEMDMLPEIANIINKPIYEIQAKLGEDCDAHNAGRPKDCFFLEQGTGSCLIYAIRPDGCRLFPTLTKTGLGKVDCLGCREFDAVVQALSSYKNEVVIHKTMPFRKRRTVPDAEWKVLFKKLETARASAIMVCQLALRNGPDEV
jgi:Fe-S-cluster containining protein